MEAATIGVEGRNWIVYSQLLLTMFLWGLAWLVGRLLAVNLPPVSIAVLRYAIVVPVLFGILRIKRQPIRLERKWMVNLSSWGCSPRPSIRSSFSTESDMLLLAMTRSSLV